MPSTQRRATVTAAAWAGSTTHHFAKTATKQTDSLWVDPMIRLMPSRNKPQLEKTCKTNFHR